MRGLAILAALAAVTACTRYDPSWTRIVTPEGASGYVVECSRTAGCIEMASDLCPRGYSVLDTGADVDYDPHEQQRENLSASATHRWPANMSKSVRYATITCGAPPAPPAIVTVTRNAPAKLPQKASSFSSGLEE